MISRFRSRIVPRLVNIQRQRFVSNFNLENDIHNLQIERLKTDENHEIVPPETPKMSYNLRARTFRETLLETQEEREVFGGEPSDDEEDDVSVFSDHSETEEESDDDELESGPSSKRARRSSQGGRPTTKLRGANGFVWKKNAPERRSDRQRDVLPENVPGPIGDAANLVKIEEFWSILFTDEMITIIVNCTNEEIENRYAFAVANGQACQTYEHHTDMNEIKAFIAILYDSGMWKSHRVDAKMLWSQQVGTSFYKCVMSYKRFLLLSSCLRFDIKSTRDPEDRLAPIRKIWEIFIANCRKNYNPSSRCTVDEQLFGFRGRCKMRIYMKSKPDKYGLMLKTLNDADTAYLIEHSSFQSQYEFIVDENGYVNVFTDGACLSNGLENPKAGIGVWFGDDHPLNVSQPIVGRSTCNVAEIMAVTEAARQARKAGVKKLKINTDSKFLIMCVTEWMKKWKIIGWQTAKKKPVINKDELIELESALLPLEVTWAHVASHSGIHGNEMAHVLAKEGIYNIKENETNSATSENEI